MSAPSSDLPEVLNQDILSFTPDPGQGMNFCIVNAGWEKLEFGGEGINGSFFDKFGDQKNEFQTVVQDPSHKITRGAIEEKEGKKTLKYCHAVFLEQIQDKSNNKSNVIFANSPKGDDVKEAQMCDAYLRIFNLANVNRQKTIVVPALGTGIYNVRPEVCAKGLALAYNVFKQYNSDIKLKVAYKADDTKFNEFKAAFDTAVKTHIDKIENVKQLVHKVNEKYGDIEAFFDDIESKKADAEGGDVALLKIGAINSQPRIVTINGKKHLLFHPKYGDIFSSLEAEVLQDKTGKYIISNTEPSAEPEKKSQISVELKKDPKTVFKGTGWNLIPYDVLTGLGIKDKTKSTAKKCNTDFLEDVGSDHVPIFIETESGTKIATQNVMGLMRAGFVKDDKWTHGNNPWNRNENSSKTDSTATKARLTKVLEKLEDNDVLLLQEWNSHNDKDVLEKAGFVNITGPTSPANDTIIAVRKGKEGLCKNIDTKTLKGFTSGRGKSRRFSACELKDGDKKTLLISVHGVGKFKGSEEDQADLEKCLIAIIKQNVKGKGNSAAQYDDFLIAGDFNKVKFAKIDGKSNNNSDPESEYLEPYRVDLKKTSLGSNYCKVKGNPTEFFAERRDLVVTDKKVTVTYSAIEIKDDGKGKKTNSGKPKACGTEYTLEKRTIEPKPKLCEKDKNLSDQIQTVIERFYGIPEYQEGGKIVLFRESNIHGERHIAHTSFIARQLILIYLSLDKYKGKKELDKENLKHILLALAFHDASRVDEDADHDEVSSAILFLSHVIENDIMPVDVAIKLSFAIAMKDNNEAELKKLKAFLESAGDDAALKAAIITGKQLKVIPLLNKDALKKARDEYSKTTDKAPEKDILSTFAQKIIHDADCLDIARVRSDFNESHAQYVKDIKGNDLNVIKTYLQPIFTACTKKEQQAKNQEDPSFDNSFAWHLNNIETKCVEAFQQQYKSDAFIFPYDKENDKDTYFLSLCRRQKKLADLAATTLKKFKIADKDYYLIEGEWDEAQNCPKGFCRLINKEKNVAYQGIFSEDGKKFDGYRLVLDIHSASVPDDYVIKKYKCFDSDPQNNENLKQEGEILVLGNKLIEDVTFDDVSTLQRGEKTRITRKKPYRVTVVEEGEFSCVPVRSHNPSGVSSYVLNDSKGKRIKTEQDGDQEELTGQFVKGEFVKGKRVTQYSVVQRVNYQDGFDNDKTLEYNKYEEIGNFKDGGLNDKSGKRICKDKNDKIVSIITGKFVTAGQGLDSTACNDFTDEHGEFDDSGKLLNGEKTIMLNGVKKVERYKDSKIVRIKTITKVKNINGSLVMDFTDEIGDFDDSGRLLNGEKTIMLNGVQRIERYQNGRIVGNNTPPLPSGGGGGSNPPPGAGTTPPSGGNPPPGGRGGAGGDISSGGHNSSNAAQSNNQDPRSRQVITNGTSGQNVSNRLVPSSNTPKDQQEDSDNVATKSEWDRLSSTEKILFIICSILLVMLPLVYFVAIGGFDKKPVKDNNKKSPKSAENNKTQTQQTQQVQGQTQQVQGQTQATTKPTPPDSGQNNAKISSDVMSLSSLPSNPMQDLRGSDV